MLKKIALAAALALPAAAMAEGLSYNFIEAGYATVDLDGGGSVDGFGFGASYLVSDPVFLRTGYSRFKKGGVEISGFNGGVGYRHALTPMVDLNATADLVFADIDAGNLGSDDDVGYSVGAAVRALVAKPLELNGGVSYTDVFDDGQVSFDIGAVYSFTSQLALVGGAEFSDGDKTYSIGGRFMF